MQLLSLLVSLTLSLLPLVKAAGTFITPGGQDGKNIYHAGGKVKVEWTGAQLPIPFCRSANSPNYPTSYTWTPRPAIYGFNKWEQNQFYLYIVYGTDFSQPFVSPSFYIRKQATTTSASTTTGSTAAPTATTTGTSSDTQQTDAPDPANSDAGGLSTGAKAGIGAGVGRRRALDHSSIGLLPTAP
ncbi:hypothetical protein PG994_009459 [Apiospora phragmitis]|uniref:Uncharacterized protein n=1 Tax=Apiospora phragmitis TaxID=2905665 RepID=A0ABR1UJC4_9PEZI